jgi:hypothetical protein
MTFAAGACSKCGVKIFWIDPLAAKIKIRATVTGLFVPGTGQND